MQIQYRKQLVDDFSVQIQRAYHDYCQRHHIAKDNKTFLNFLFNHQLLNETSIRRFIIQGEFQKLSENKNIRKSEAVRLLSDRYGVTERSVWNLIR